MKTNHLFLTLFGLLCAFSTAFAQSTTDHIDYSFILTGTDVYGYSTMNSQAVPSGTSARYTVFVQKNNNCIKFIDATSNIVSTVSGGRIKSVTVDWASSGNLSGVSTIVIYGNKTAYADNYTSSWQNKVGTKIAEIVYPNTTATGLDLGKYSNVMIGGSGEPSINSVDLEWMSVSTFDISIGEHNNGEISLSSTSAEQGEQITVTFTPTPFMGLFPTELRSYTIDGVTTNLTPAQYSGVAKSVKFTMPNHPVTISAVFDMAPSRVGNNVTVDASAQVEGKTITIVSGKSYTFNFGADYALTGFNGHAAYQGAVTVNASNGAMATLSNASYNSATGRGSFKLTAYNQGNSSLTFSTVQTNDYNASTITYTIKVVPREVMLITEYNGEHYAVVNNLVAGKLPSQKVALAGGKAYVYGDATSLDLMKWKVCTKTDGTFTIQNSANQYLGYSPSSPATLTLSATVSNWYKYLDAGENRFYNSGNEIVLYSDNFANYSYDLCNNNDAYSHGAIEVDRFEVMSSQTIRTDLTPDAFNTVCLPYSFIAADGLSVYSVDNYEEVGSMYNFYFCQLDKAEPTVAGQPYIIKSTSATAKVYQKGTENAPAGDYNGLHGTMSNLAWNTVWNTGKYTLGNVLVITADGSIKYATNGNGGIYANRAYMLLDEIPTTSECSGDTPAGAPRRVQLSVEETQTPTEIESLESAEIINWNLPVYNVLGQQVSRGTTGVLLQDGRKYFAQ